MYVYTYVYYCLYIFSLRGMCKDLIQLISFQFLTKGSHTLSPPSKKIIFLCRDYFAFEKKKTRSQLDDLAIKKNMKTEKGIKRNAYS